MPEYMPELIKIEAPSSKSHSLRAILFASLADGDSEVYNILPSPDAEAMITACRQLGAKVTKKDSYLKITGVAGEPKLTDKIIDAGNSGQVLRFVGAICSLIAGTTTLTGDESIRTKRPVLPLISAVEQLGGYAIAKSKGIYAPLAITGPISPGIVTMAGEDSQPVSAMLIACSFMAGISEINVINPGEQPWINLTLTWLRSLGAVIENHNYQSYLIHGSLKYRGFNYTVPGDFSSIAFPLAAALLTNRELVITGLNPDDSQGDKDIITILVASGANIKFLGRELIFKPTGKISGIQVDLNNCIDALPILTVIACFANSPSKFSNVAIARSKESDRLATIKLELTKMGAKIKEGVDSLEVWPAKLMSASLDSHNDHRIAMALYVANIAIGSQPKINNLECIQKSYPNFCQIMKVFIKEEGS